MMQHASAFHFLSAAINMRPKMPQLFMLLAGNFRLIWFINQRTLYSYALSLMRRRQCWHHQRCHHCLCTPFLAVFLANKVPTWQMSSGSYGSIFFWSFI